MVTAVLQKRPEDHPNYGEEWKLFWKKRYNELIQGRSIISFFMFGPATSNRNIEVKIISCGLRFPNYAYSLELSKNNIVIKKNMHIAYLQIDKI